ncbi:MAG: hypothetical protein HXY21_13155 [Parvularculaceae bacterium]|nr:hypothetical protein [Parvularculaceae bacterium]
MVRSIIGVLVGVIIGAFIVLAVEAVSHQAFPPPAAFDAKDAGAVAALPLGAKLSVLFAWFSGAFGGAVAALAIARRWAPAGWVVAATILLFAATNFAAFPHPLWMIIASIPATLAGGQLAILLTRANYGRPPAPPKPGL